MRRVSDGYTIIEVMIFLAISLVIATAAWNLISGKQAQTDFDQKMRDTQSQIQSWLNDVSNGFTGGDPTNQSCTIGSNGFGSVPLVKNTAPGSNYTPSCVFLGKAIQFNDQNAPNNQDEELYVYSVFGCRLIGCPANPTSADQFPSNLSEASPIAADGLLPGQADLTGTFDLSPAHVAGICTNSQASCNGPGSFPSVSTQSHLIAFYNSFNANQNGLSNGAEDLNIYQYPFNQNVAKNDSSVDECLQSLSLSPCKITSPAVNPPPLTNYEFCLTDGQRYAVISITSNSGIGATTDLRYVSQSQC